MGQDYTKAANYDRWATDNNYNLVSGLFVLPVAEDPPTDSEALKTWSPVVVIRAHAQYALRQVTFDVQKKGTPPVVPSPTDAGCFRFLGGSLDFPGPAVNQSANKFDWNVTGVYLYAQTLRSDPSDGYVLTGFPFPLELQAQNAVQYQQAGEPNTGPVTVAGNDAKIGYAQGMAISLSDPYWKYNTATYFPGTLFDSTIVNGG